MYSRLSKKSKANSDKRQNGESKGRDLIEAAKQPQQDPRYAGGEKSYIKWNITKNKQSFEVVAKLQFCNNNLRFKGKTGLLDGFSKACCETNRVLQQALFNIKFLMRQYFANIPELNP